VAKSVPLTVAQAPTISSTGVVPIRVGGVVEIDAIATIVTETDPAEIHRRADIASR